jgi:hypothetical protein
MNAAQKVIIPEARNLVRYESYTLKWSQKMDVERSEKYMARWRAMMSIDLEWPRLREQVMKLRYNWDFIAECYAIQILEAKKVIKKGLWNQRIGKRYEMIERTNYTERCCWATLLNIEDKGQKNIEDGIVMKIYNRNGIKLENVVEEA